VAGLFVVGSFGAGLAGEINETDGLAIEGYDPVAYFSEHKPVQGPAAFTASQDGVTYRFASAAHRDQFLANPAAYLPQYGGFCAYATAKGYKADADPTAFSVVSGKLYLNYNADIQAEWSKDPVGYITNGDRSWSTVSKLTDIVR
jgi:YHS domain-containing protein